MELQGARRQQHGDGADGGGGVKVKFIETQFVSSDAASFKSLVQRLTGRNAPMPPPPANADPRVSRPRERAAQCPAAAGAGWAGHGSSAYASVPGGGGGDLMEVASPIKQEAHGGMARAPPSLEDLHELCDYADLLYATTADGGRRGGGGGFPY